MVGGGLTWEVWCLQRPWGPSKVHTPPASASLRVSCALTLGGVARSKGCPGDLPGGPWSQAYRDMWHSSGAGQRGQHRRTNKEKPFPMWGSLGL